MSILPKYQNLAFFYKLFTCGDKLLVAFFLLSSLIALLAINHLQNQGGTVSIGVSGQIKHQFSLKDDREIQVSGPLGLTQIQIKNQKVRIISSACPDKICVNTGWISSTYQMIVCVPNQIVINITGVPNYHFDVITQ